METTADLQVDELVVEAYLSSLDYEEVEELAQNLGTGAHNVLRVVRARGYDEAKG